MGSATKKSKAERQAALNPNGLRPVVIDIPEDNGDIDLDDLLGDNPVLPAKTTKEGKSPKVSRERSLKGQLVAFKNKDGKTIIGHGVQYYVARFNGRLHYKEASQVTILPEDWKEGDAIPE